MIIKHIEGIVVDRCVLLFFVVYVLVVEVVEILVVMILLLFCISPTTHWLCLLFDSVISCFCISIPSCCHKNCIFSLGT